MLNYSIQFTKAQCIKCFLLINRSSNSTFNLLYFYS